MNKTLVLILFTLVIASGCASNEPAVVPLVEEQQQTLNQQGAAAASSELLQLEQSLRSALVNGHISPDTYSQIDQQLKQFEEKGLNTDSARQILSQLQIGGQQQTVEKQNFESENSQPVQATTIVQEQGPTEPILKNIGFNLGKYDPATRKAGDVLFVNGIGDHFSNKIFLEFAHEVNGADGPKILPHPTYFLPLGTKIISPVQGQIDKIIYQERDNDYEIHIIPNGLQNWRLSFDHVINVKIKEGDMINPGDILGEVAKASSSEIPPELGWTELQIWQSSGTPLMVCPFTLLDESVKNDIETKLMQLAEDWEKFTGKNVYSQEKWTSPGCLAESASD